MKDAIQIINEIRKTPQYRKHILIMAKLTDFKMKHGYDFPEKKILHNFKISHREYADILAGSRSISPNKYTKVLKYLNSQCS